MFFKTKLIKKVIFYFKNQIRAINLYKPDDVTYYNLKQTLSTARQCYDEIIKYSDYDQRKSSVEEFNLNSK